MILALINQSLILMGLIIMYSNPPKDPLWNVIIDDRFLVQEGLGKGYTGFVRSGKDLETNEEVAIKFASEIRYWSLEKEYKNYIHLGARDPNVVQRGIPHIIHFGDFDQYKYLVMSKTGPTLHKLKDKTKDKEFTFTSIAKIGRQGIRIFEYIHSKGLIFHDVKPHNIAVGRSNANKIVFFDFAFSEFYIDDMGVSKPRKEATKFYGTPDYMAWGPLNRYTQVRKDDLISFGLVLLELNGVILPWSEITKEYDNIYITMDVVLEQWNKHSIDDICDKSDNPHFFKEYFNYLDSFKSQERPDYDFLVQLFENELTEEELADDDLGIISTDNTKTHENAQVP
ncbi:casein kinase I-like isoform X2 [Sitodiplosis mosellana]|uniref:casein kinase I-like isoform X2 n=1 Tax=Sitodiplosis mosellana TaxID=263140 RepID=UPI0024448713|nr:casein kinase I-like isoform X2 [Sitodiplosis mosellana]